ncbi:MAG: DUF2905 domain-containing protein [Candidatus Schekmanbacteria bacterium]|nr:MAG: DUF2905 domain-containing protein [Candidatus Schekmanbacteria bacterium]
MMFGDLGKILFFTGILIAAIGLFLMLSNTLSGKIPFIDKLGKLPGDIRIEKKNFSFYFPLTTCIIISIILTLILRFFFRR